MRYTYDCTHPDCGATVVLFRRVDRRNDPANCPASASHEMRRRAVEGVPSVVWLASGATRGAMAPGWAEKIDKQYRETQKRTTLEAHT